MSINSASDMRQTTADRISATKGGSPGKKVFFSAKCAVYFQQRTLCVSLYISSSMKAPHVGTRERESRGSFCDSDRADEDTAHVRCDSADEDTAHFRCLGDLSWEERR